MKNLLIFLATGFEEIEVVSTMDVIRRAGLNIQSVALTEELLVIGAHGIGIQADVLFDSADFSTADMLILPGGMPGTKNLNAHGRLKEALINHAKSGKQLAAICAAPMVLGQLGLLAGKEATCYPGNEMHLKDAKISEYMVVDDAGFITASGPGVAIEFGLQIVEHYMGDEKVEEVSKALLLA